MTADEMEEVKELVKDMDETANNGHYFEINAETTRLLYRYIRELEEVANV